MPLRLHNTIARAKQDFEPVDPNHVRMYVCGPTVYGDIHIGNAPGRVMAKPVLVALGVLTGFGSAMSGTGGPLILLPILLWLNIPVISAIGVAQAIQAPIALLATGGNFLSGDVAVLIGLVIALALICGIAAGAAFAHALAPSALKRGVALVVFIVGTGILVRLFAAQFAI